MSTSQLNSVGTEVSTGTLCFIDPSLLGFVAEIMYYYQCYVCGYPYCHSYCCSSYDPCSPRYYADHFLILMIIAIVVLSLSC